MSNVYDGYVWRPDGERMKLVAMASQVVASSDRWAPYAVTSALLKRQNITGKERQALNALNDVARKRATGYAARGCWPGWKLEVKKVASAPQGADCIVVR